MFVYEVSYVYAYKHVGRYVCNQNSETQSLGTRLPLSVLVLCTTNKQPSQQ